MTTPREAHAVLAEIRLRAGLHFTTTVDLVTTDRNDGLDGGWKLPATGKPVAMARTERHLPDGLQATTLANLVREYAAMTDRDHKRVTTNPRFPRSIELDIRHDPMKCPQCGATHEDRGGKLGGMLERWHDSQGSGWQCHNTECQWYSVDDEIE